MKKFFYSILAAATMLFATTSCSQDEEIVNGGPVSGKTQKVTFKVEMPGETASRAIADGVEVAQANMANKLAWALYETTRTGGDPVATGNAEKAANSKEFTVDIDMVKGLEYKVLFLAYNEGGTIFDVAAGDDLKSLNFKSGLVSNNEAYDAFVACHTHTVNSETVTSVTLKRPFAQVNVGTTDTDLTKAANLQAAVFESQLVINDVPTQYNVLTGEATALQPVIFGKNTILYNTAGKNETLANVDGKNYNYLNMVYVLAGEGTNTSSTHTATYTFYREGDATPIRTLNVNNLPIERNYRTNIVGDIITQTEKFNIVIDARFETPDYNIIYAGGTAANPDELENAMDDINNNAVEDAVIKIPAGSYVSWTTGAGHGSTPLVNVDNTVTKTVTIQGEGESSVLVVNGSGVGALRAANGAKLIFKNLTIVDNSVSYNENAWELTYLEFAGNLEFENVTFKGGITLQREDNDVDLNATFNNCTFITEEASVYGVWVSDGTSTFNNCYFKGTRGLKMHEDYGSEIASVTIDGCEFGPLSKKPGIAIGDLNPNTTVTIKNSTFNGCQAGDQGNYIYETDTDVTTFTFVTENNTVNPIATTADEFNALLANANFSEFFLGEDVVIEGTFTVNRNVKISSVNPDKKATIKGRINSKGDVITSITYSNLKFEVNDESKVVWPSGGSDMRSKPSIIMAEANFATITFINCEFELKPGAFAYTNTSSTKTVFNYCTFNGTFNYAMYVRANIEISNCTYNTTVTNVLTGANVNSLANGKVVFVNNTLNNGSNIDLTGAIVFLSTNNTGNTWAGPVEFTVKNNTGFAYSYERMGNFIVNASDHTFTDGSDTFNF